MNKNLVIIPTFNERDNILKVIDEVLTLTPVFHVLIVDDGSPDGTADLVKEVVREHPVKVHLIERAGKMGLGTAYLTGFKWALERDYAYICEMDADFSHNPKDLKRLVETCEQGADIAIGSRYISGVNVINWPIDRVLMSYFASFYVRLITGMPFRDCTAGFKCYRRKVLKSIDPKKISFVGYAFQIEMKFNAWKRGYKLVEIPIIFTDRVKGQSKMSSGIFKEAILGVLQMKIKSLFQKFEPDSTPPGPNQIEWLSRAEPS